MNEDPDSDLHSEITNTGGASTAPSFEIAPEDRHHADAILAMDPFNDVPTPHQMPEGWAANVPLRASMLPPAMQADVRAKLATVPPAQRAAKEAEFTADAIKGMRGELRIKTGVGKDATPYHREMVGIAREVYDLSAEYSRLQAQLEEVERYENSVDPATGEAKPLPGRAGALGHSCNGAYYALHEAADGHRDSQTGRCTSISTQYRIRVAPAFVVDVPSAGGS